MIDTFYIPTYRRLEKQLTWASLPAAFQKRTLLVVSEDEADAFTERYGAEHVLVCPLQGTGIAPVRQWIAEHARDSGVEKYTVLDDDIKRWWHRPGHCPSPAILLDDDAIIKLFDETVSNALDEYVQVGMVRRATFPAPADKGDIQTPATIAAAQSFNAKRLPVADLEWTKFDHCEDLHLSLQLTLLNMPALKFIRYCYEVAPDHSEGGCKASGRDDGNHDKSMRGFAAAYPGLVSERWNEKHGRWYARANLRKALEQARTKEKAETGGLSRFF